MSIEYGVVLCTVLWCENVKYICRIILTFSCRDGYNCVSEYKPHFVLHSTCLLWNISGICCLRRCKQIVKISQRAIQTGIVIIRKTCTVTAVKLFTTFIASFKIFSCPFRINIYSSNLKVLYKIIGSINIHICTILFKHYTTWYDDILRKYRI